MIKLLKRFIYPRFVDAASLASVAGIIIVFCSQNYAVIIALSTFCLILLLMLVGVIFALNRIIKTGNQKEYNKVSSFYVFKTEDGIKSTFETYRLIQCKRPILTQIEYKYKWSGSRPPIMTSKNQEIEQYPPNNDAHTWDKAIIKFRRPLVYNESTVIHIKTENDDVDKTAKPWVECRLESPIEIMQFRILLGYKNKSYSKKAYFKRKKLDAETGSDFEILHSVDFDSQYKQYYHVEVNPTPGYTYRLEWEK